MRTVLYEDGTVLDIPASVFHVQRKGKVVEPALIAPASDGVVVVLGEEANGYTIFRYIKAPLKDFKPYGITAGDSPMEELLLYIRAQINAAVPELGYEVVASSNRRTPVYH